MWREISSAPKDGTKILIGRGGRNKLHYVMEAFWDSKFGRFDCYVGIPSKAPTHWMPLPDSPCT